MRCAFTCPNEAAYRARFARPCGHRHLSICPGPVCVAHAAWLRTAPEARKTSTCPVCGERNIVAVSSLETLDARFCRTPAGH